MNNTEKTKFWVFILVGVLLTVMNILGKTIAFINYDLKDLFD